MPLYEYECTKCGHRFEQIQLYSDPLVKKCPKCKKGRVKKLLSAPAVQFKGTGWYVTDYARKGTTSSLPDQGGEPSKEKAGKESEKKAAGQGSGAGAESSTGKESSGKDSPGKDAAGGGAADRDAAGRESARRESARRDGGSRRGGRRS